MASDFARTVIGSVVFSALAFACAVPAAASSARASAQYSSADVLKAFQPAPGLGASRSICIGTESECGAASAPAAPATTFDMLITFDYNSDNLTSTAKANLDEFAKALRDQRLSSRHFDIGGHTDAEGSHDYQGLSDRRAAAVVSYLTGKGVERSKLVARGYGKSQPRTANPFDATNRRVEARLSE